MLHVPAVVKLSNDGLSQKSKLVASKKAYINVVVIDVLYLLIFTRHNGMSLIHKNMK